MTATSTDPFLCHTAHARREKPDSSVGVRKGRPYLSVPPILYAGQNAWNLVKADTSSKVGPSAFGFACAE
jgi:hypothetical protein